MMFWPTYLNTWLSVRKNTPSGRDAMFQIKGQERLHVYHFALNVLGSQSFGRFHYYAERGTIAHDGNIFAFPDHFGHT